MPCILEADVSKKRCQKNWARLIRKIYEVNPLVCSKCNGHMRITGSQAPKPLLHHGFAGVCPHRYYLNSAWTSSEFTFHLSHTFVAAHRPPRSWGRFDSLTGPKILW